MEGVASYPTVVGAVLYHLTPKDGLNLRGTCKAFDRAVKKQDVWWVAQFGQSALATRKKGINLCKDHWSTKLAEARKERNSVKGKLSRLEQQLIKNRRERNEYTSELASGAKGWYRQSLRNKWTRRGENLKKIKKDIIQRKSQLDMRERRVEVLVAKRDEARKAIKKVF